MFQSKFSKSMASLIQILLILSLISLSCTFDRRRLHTFMRPKSLNTRGWVGRGQSCKEGHVVVGFRIKVAGFSEHGDNTAMNGVRLICSDGNEILSLEGAAGVWTDDVWCSRVDDHKRGDDFIAGVKIRTEHWRGFDVDDLGAINLEAICHSGIRLLHQPKADWINHRGQWSKENFCPPETPAICGIKSRVHNKDQGDAKGDLAGLTELQFKCCTVPGMHEDEANEISENVEEEDYYEDQSNMLFVE